MRFPWGHLIRRCRLGQPREGRAHLASVLPLVQHAQKASATRHRVSHGSGRPVQASWVRTTSQADHFSVGRAVRMRGPKVLTGPMWSARKPNGSHRLIFENGPLISLENREAIKGLRRYPTHVCPERRSKPTRGAHKSLAL